ncbi:maternal effect embryo arrest 9 [Tasmannia lanceolata]|uniref:maternal effect embryo arrest 9 n=1 Tax=Tasmannia lanceolata TaxID=3420 RepID=UPI0040638813
MDALLSQFSFLAKQALQDKNFDPMRMEELMKLFDIEAYNSWAAMEVEGKKEAEEAEISMREAEEHLESLMDMAMEDFHSFNHEVEHTYKAELNSLVRTAKAVKKLGDSVGKSAAIASKKYIDAANLSAMASMKSAWNGFSITPSKVHPA